MLSARILPSITLCRFGTPFPTDAVIIKPAPSALVETETPPHFRLEAGVDYLKFLLPLTSDDAIYGLGENMGPLNRRGQRYRCFALDEPHHAPDRTGLYSSHPFCIVQGGAQTFGVFADFAGELFFDCAFWHADTLEIFVPALDCDLYLIEGESVSEVVKQFLTLVGSPCVPPLWSFGFQQSRYSYPNEAAVRRVAKEFRQHDIPCDAIHLDIDYMDGYKIFTVNEKHFPDLPALNADLRKDGIKTVAIIDPGVKVEPGYEIYDAGIAGGHFCKTPEGEPFSGGVWPGLTHLPDFLNEGCCKWWGGLYKDLRAQGVEGFWNDMNEPAIFYTPEAIATLAEAAETYSGVRDLGTEPGKMLSVFGPLWKSEEFFKQFVHDTSHGEVLHREVHNLYGAAMARASANGLAKMRPDERDFLLTRSSYIGTHRHAVIWTGDNHSWWEHMLLHMRMMQSLNLCGFFFCGADVGGFSGDCSAELMVRWTQLGAFSPLFRNHSNKGTRAQEPFAFGEEPLRLARGAIRLRYALLSYAYSEFLSSVREQRPFIRPLFLDFDSPRTRGIEDQFLFGRSLMAAPVHAQGARGRYVHLPHGRWLHWPASSEARAHLAVMESGDYFVPAELGVIPLFLRQDHLVSLQPPRHSTEQAPDKKLTALGLVCGEARLELTLDDGKSAAWMDDRWARITLEARRTPGGYTVRAACRGRSPLADALEQVAFELYDEHGNRHDFEVRLERS